MKDILEEALQELFIAMTARWRREDGTLGIGVPKNKILKAGEITAEVMENLLQRLKEKMSSLGMEVIEYFYEGEIWYAVRSTYICPSELKSEEEATLAVIISAIESSSEVPKRADVEIVKKKLLGGKYFTESQLERTLKQLEQAGYIQKRKQYILYSPRTLLEFSEEVRKHLVEEANRLIF